MKEHKIFKPDMLFQDYIRSSWRRNVKTIDGKMPISQFLKSKGVWALEISPLKEQKWYSFGLPVNKNWETETFEQKMDIHFSVYAETKFSMGIMFQNSEQKNSDVIPVSVNASDDSKVWDTLIVPCPFEDIRMVLFSGSAQTPDYVIKDIVLKSH